MKKFLMLTLLLAFCLPALATAADDKDKVYELSLTSEGYRDNHVVTQKVWMPWIEEVEKRSNGRLKIVFYSPGTICGRKDVPDAVIKGRADIGHTLFSTNPGMYAYSDVGEANVPGVNSVASAMGFSDYVNQNDWVKQELDNDKTKLLSVWSTGPAQICSKEPITKLSDLKGKKIGYHMAGMDKIITALGGVPVLVMPPDIYMSMQRGQTDAQIMALTVHRPFKLYEVMTEVNDFPLLPGYHYLVMNRKTYDSLPTDLQQILDETTGEMMAKQVAEVIDAEVNDGLQWMLENDKAHVSKFDPEEETKMTELLVPFKEEWIESLEKRGYPRAREAIELFRTSLENANQKYGDS